MRTKLVFSIAVLVALLLGALPVLAAVDTGAALDYLKTQQNADGGFGSGFSPDSGVGSTADALMAIVAVGGDPSAFDQGGNTPVSYLAVQASSVATAGDLAKLIMAAIAAGENPRVFGGVDSVAKLEAMIGGGGKIGGEADTFVSTPLAVMALAAAQRPIPASAVEHMKAAQQENGSWAWDGTAETAGDTNTTAFVVQSLVAAGEAPGSEVVTKALAYAKSIQNEDGGWPYQNPSEYGTATDANSTAVTIQAIVAGGQDPTGSAWALDGATPTAALEAFQNESGAFAWQVAMPDDNLLATVQALPAVAGKAFPLASMNVGEAAAAPPATIPETGGSLLNMALPVLLVGLALTGGGMVLRRKH